MDILQQFSREDWRDLAALVNARPGAALSTLREGAPNLGFVLAAPAPDFSAFYLHLSRLALHTQDLRANPVASLLIVERDADNRNPLTLARLSLRGAAVPLLPQTSVHAAAQAVYLKRFPQAAVNFNLPDFELFSFVPAQGRYVAGLGQAFKVSPDDLRQAAIFVPAG